MPPNGIERCVWLSIAPGSTKQPVASITSASTPSNVPTPATDSPSIRTSAATVSTAFTTVPPRITFLMRRLPGEWGLRVDDICARSDGGCLTYALAPVDAVLFGALSGALFGALAVAVRHGLSRGVPAEVGATVSAIVAFLVVGAIALVSGSFSDPIDTRDVLVFAAIGAGVPGLSQIAFVQAIRHAGAARAAVLIGVAPMLSFILAAIFLGEGINAGLVAGAALIVTAGASLSFERSKPPGYRALGAVLAVLCAGLFAMRDTLVRWASGDATLDATGAHHGLRSRRPRSCSWPGRR